MKKTIIEATVLHALDIANQKRKHQEILESVCQKNGHTMTYSSLYRCYICSVCGHTSDKQKDGYNWDDYH